MRKVTTAAFIFIAFTILALILKDTTLAGPIPDTGQTKCYNNSSEIPCPQPGESFYGQDAQYNTNPQSYTKLDASGNDLPDEATEWVMVRDNVSGLIWEVKTVDNKDDTYNWSGSLSYCENLSLGGFSDWRLPTIIELSFIQNMDTNTPTIDTNYFPNTSTSYYPYYYWSSTVRAYSSRYSYAWVVNFVRGNRGSDIQSNYNYVRAVRGGQPESFYNFVINNDGTITDRATGLMWQEVTVPGTFTWEDALQYCEDLILNNDGEWTSGIANESGTKYDDWRLPNVNELQTLVDYQRSYLAIDPIFAHRMPLDAYLSSTTSPYQNSSVSGVSFILGSVFPEYKTDPPSYVRAVRDGLCGPLVDLDNDGILDDGDNNGSPSYIPCTVENTENCDDNCFNTPNPDQADIDSDGVGDVCDNCWEVANINQLDTDSDGAGNVCDPDDDGDGIFDDGDGSETIGDNPCFDGSTINCDDNCIDMSNSNQADRDSDGIGDLCDNKTTIETAPTFPHPIPDTGQTTCTDDNLRNFPCPLPGEPFYGQDAQYTINPQSYTKLGDGGIELDDTATSWLMIRDNVTGLIWENKTNDGSIHDKDNTYNWYDAQDVFIAELNSTSFGGFTDWRLPTIKELIFIQNMNDDPAINTNYFIYTPPDEGDGYYYWSSTTAAPDIGTDKAWVAEFYWGNYSYRRDKSSNSYTYVRAVRGEEFYNNFIDNGNLTITDTSTGLMWQQDRSPSLYFWQEALAYCENLTLAGHTDWRLPNSHELRSLVDFSSYDPTIDLLFTNTTDLSYEYFSSTACKWGIGSDHRWTVFFLSGGSYSSYLGMASVRCVRNAVIDSDGDGIPDDGDNSGSPSDTHCTGGATENCDDNCVGTPNLDQGDIDSDSIGDVCDNCPNDPENDIDGDTICGDIDNCPFDSNLDQLNSDTDEVGDVCDNCPDDDNEDQSDSDNDGVGDVCDTDDDNDGILDDGDNSGIIGDNPCIGGSIIDCDDNCQLDNNPGQDNFDNDDMGDVCDPDDDNDGVNDAQDAFPYDPEESLDTDGDGIGNNADPDDDGDGICDPGVTDSGCSGSDNCPLISNTDQSDNDIDGMGDACDPDDDNDGVNDDQDAFPYDPNESFDSDIDGTGDNADTDDDNDGILDDGDGSGIIGDNPCTGGNLVGCDDNCQFAPNEFQIDDDSNGVGDVCDVSPPYETMPDISDPSGSGGSLTVHEMFSTSVGTHLRNFVVDAVRDDYSMYIASAAKKLLTVDASGTYEDINQGSMDISISQGQYTLLPSAAADMHVLSYFLNDQYVNFFKDGADNYYIRSSVPSGIYSLYFTVGTDYSDYRDYSVPADMTLADIPEGVLNPVPIGVQGKVDWFLGWLSTQLRDPGNNLYYDDLRGETDVDIILDNLIPHFRSFDCEAFEDAPGYDEYQIIATQKHGACRHRAFSFFVTANGLGLPTRYVTNTAHAFVEVYIPDGTDQYSSANWHLIDLGGCSSGSIVLVPVTLEYIDIVVQITSNTDQIDKSETFDVEVLITNEYGSLLDVYPFDVYIGKDAVNKIYAGSGTTNENGLCILSLPAPEDLEIGDNFIYVFGKPYTKYNPGWSNPSPIYIVGCIDGETRACPNQEGICAGSTETCIGNLWPGCDYSTMPSYELSESLCEDGSDNDCDGLTDCTDLDCDGVEFGNCNTGELGVCAEGTDKCLEGGRVCNRNTDPSNEVCDNLDSDCDGSIDEDLSQSCGTGACVGTKTCSEGSWGNCSTYNNECDDCALCSAEGECSVFKPSSTLCRPQAGDCDVDDYCTGTSPECPDAKSTGLCRAIAGDCDVVEVCDGIGNNCPPDGFQPAGYECRTSTGECDPEEYCAGDNAYCPVDYQKGYTVTLNPGLLTLVNTGDYGVITALIEEGGMGVGGLEVTFNESSDPDDAIRLFPMAKLDAEGKAVVEILSSSLGVGILTVKAVDENGDEIQDVTYIFEGPDASCATFDELTKTVGVTALPCDTEMIITCLDSMGNPITGYLIASIDPPSAMTGEAVPVTDGSGEATVFIELTGLGRATVSASVTCGINIGEATVCSDIDGDGVCDDEDNCPDTPNGPHSGTCSEGSNKGDPCTTAGGNTNECGDGGFCSMDQEDTDIDDSDGIGDVCDNCPEDYNPDQLNSDTEDGGDVCDVCPNDSTNTCDQDRSAGDSIGPVGGIISTPDDSVIIDIPAGALNDDRSLSITETGTSYELTTNLGNGIAVFGVSIQPEGLVFNTPVTIVFTWLDVDDDGKVDGTRIKEDKLIISKDNVAVTDRCGQDPGCDTIGNTFTFMVSSLSEFALAFVDDEGPITSNILTNPFPAPVDTEILLTANVDDSQTGDSIVGSAKYNIDGSEHIQMDAQDGIFDDVIEDVAATIPAFTEPGVYNICVHSWDIFENIEGNEECIFLPVYDPMGGFVTGGGWIYSPEGAYYEDDTLTGKATFGFVSKYKKGATVPTGVTQFQFKVADLKFHSDTYEWLVIAGAKAKYKGIGAINGEGEYKFMLTAVDDDINESDSFEIDRFRIKIWTEDEFDEETVIYDNALGDDSDEATTEIGGGSIVIHK